MVVKEDYWEDDELQDRLWHAREAEERRQSYRPTRSDFHWTLSRTKTIPLVFGLLLIAWWILSSIPKSTKVNWSRYAYSQYATDTQSLCNALMVFASLHKLGSKADKVLLYPEQWMHRRETKTAWLLEEAKKKYGVKLEPVQLLGADGKIATPGTLAKPDSGWNLSITKLRVFDLLQYDRVLHIDSDITLLQHMDELFSLPPTPIAMPRAYWSHGPFSNWQLTSLIMLVEPSSHEVPAMMKILREWQKQPTYAQSNKYDMDLLNDRFGGSAMVLPHRPYTMLTAEFRSKNHTRYMGNPHAHPLDQKALWDPDKALAEAKLIHFSDWPLPKPWIMWPSEGLAEMQPDCGGSKKGTCREREIWKKLYDDFRHRRKDICGILSVPAPDWGTWKKDVGAGGTS
jgi:hypothetical protein